MGSHHCPGGEKDAAFWWSGRGGNHAVRKQKQINFGSSWQDTTKLETLKFKHIKSLEHDWISVTEKPRLEALGRWHAILGGCGRRATVASLYLLLVNGYTLGFQMKIALARTAHPFDAIWIKTVFLIVYWFIIWLIEQRLSQEQQQYFVRVGFVKSK